MNDEIGALVGAFSCAEMNIQMLEGMAKTRKEKRIVQTWGWLVGVRECPEPSLKYRILPYFWMIEDWFKGLRRTEDGGRRE